VEEQSGIMATQEFFRPESARKEPVGKTMVPRKAERLYRQGRAQGEARQFDSAIKLLARSIQIAPYWANPRYDLAFLWLRKGDGSRALEHYREVDLLQPDGFFITKTAIWCLERERSGIFPQGTYLTFMLLQWEELGKRSEAVARMTVNLPSFAPAWKERALLTEDSIERRQFLEQALSLEPDAETYGICILNQAALLNNSGMKSEARNLIEELAQSQKATASSKIRAREILSSWKE